jgi:hypothetical protein
LSDYYTSVLDSLTTAGIAGSHVKKRIGEIVALDSYAAKRVADGLEALILEFATSVLAGISEWPESRGFAVLPEPIEGGSSGKTRLYLQLLDERYRDVFHALCTDVCVVLVEASAENEAIRAFHSRLVRWQSFLQKHGPEGLGPEARCGLFGELLVLRDLLIPTMETGAVLRAWRGCKKAHQDFQFPDRALEVKTTRAPIPDRVTISNVQQLDGAGIQCMILTVVHVHENESTGESLPEMVDSLRVALPDDARDLLDAGLEEVGYSDAHQDLYSKTRYQHIGLLHFEVRDGFPRITRDQISDGVKRVKYEVGIDACRKFQIDEAAVLQLLKDGRKSDGDND